MIEETSSSSSSSSRRKGGRKEKYEKKLGEGNEMQQNPRTGMTWTKIFVTKTQIPASRPNPTPPKFSLPFAMHRATSTSKATHSIHTAISIHHPTHPSITAIHSPIEKPAKCSKLQSQSWRQTDRHASHLCYPETRTIRIKELRAPCVKNHLSTIASTRFLSLCAFLYSSLCIKPNLMNHAWP